MIRTSAKRAPPVFTAALAAALAGCGQSSGTAPDAAVEQRHAVCFIAGTLTQCYNDWPLFNCVSPNRYVQDTTCGGQGLCQDACSGTWLECSVAETTCSPPAPTPSSTCTELCKRLFECRGGQPFSFMQRVDADNCPSICDGWSSNLIECVQRMSCPYLSGAFPACLSVPNKECDRCLESCRGYSGCCTGEGCVCQSAC